MTRAARLSLTFLLSGLLVSCVATPPAEPSSGPVEFGAKPRTGDSSGVGRKGLDVGGYMEMSVGREF